MTHDEMDMEVLEILRDPKWQKVPMWPSVMCRALNSVRPRSWCPVGPPKPGERCATVPASSRRTVDVVLDRLFRHGLVAVYLSRRSGRAVKTYLDPFVARRGVQ